MKNVLISVYDKKAEVYAAPVLFRNDEEAKRGYVAAIEKDSMLSRFSDDYKLVRVGFFDNERGIVTPCLEDVSEVSDLSFRKTFSEVIPAPRADVQGIDPEFKEVHK